MGNRSDISVQSNNNKYQEFLFQKLNYNKQVIEKNTESIIKSFLSISSNLETYFKKVEIEINLLIKKIIFSKSYIQSFLYQTSINSLQVLLIKHQNFFSCFETLLDNYSSFLSKEVALFPHIEKKDFEIYNSDDINSNKYILEINGSDSIGQGKNILIKRGNIALKKIKAKLINDDDIKYLFGIKNESHSQNQYQREANKISLKNCYINDFDFCEFFSGLYSFKLKNSKISFNIMDNIYTNFGQLTSLELDRVDLVTANFNSLINSLLKNNLGNNLKILSLKNNKISSINIEETNKNKYFPSLDILNLSNNNLDDFPNKTKTTQEQGKTIETQEISEPFNNLKFLDLSNNNISEFFPIENLLKIKPPVIIILSKNFGVVRKKFITKYCEVLSDRINKYHSQDLLIKTLNFEGLFRKNENNEILYSINIFKFSCNLIELNLSFCHVNNEGLFSILNKRENMCLKALKKLILVSNILTEEVLKLIIDNELYNVYSSLKKIDLSSNKINFSNVFFPFFEKFLRLKKFIIKNTEANEKIINYIKQYFTFYSNKRVNEIKQFKNDNELINKLLENHYLKNNTNVTIFLDDMLTKIQEEKIKNILPELLERIVIEN